MLCKILSLLEPWASLVALRKKKFETRSWKTPHRGRMGIHASAGHRPWHMNLARKEPFFSALAVLRTLVGGKDGRCRFAIRYRLGHIIATCNLVDIYLITETELIQINPSEGQEPKRLPLPTGDEYEFGDYTPGRYAWELQDVVMLEKPIKAKGKLMLWEHDLGEADANV